MSSTLTDISCDSYIGDGMELIDPLSLPVLMVSQAVQNMAQVEQIADKITEEERKNLIMEFISAILFVVPVAGEVLGTVSELADVSAIITMTGEVGNTAMGVYDIVKDPHNAPLAIMNLIFAPAALSDAASIAKAARFRRGMKDADVAKLGERVSSRIGAIRKLTGKCKL